MTENLYFLLGLVVGAAIGLFLWGLLASTKNREAEAQKAYRNFKNKAGLK